MNEEEFLFKQTEILSDVVVTTLKETELEMPVVLWTEKDVERFLNHLLFNYQAAIAKDNPERAAEVLQATEQSSKDMIGTMKNHLLTVVREPARQYLQQ